MKCTHCNKTLTKEEKSQGSICRIWEGEILASMYAEIDEESEPADANVDFIDVDQKRMGFWDWFFIAVGIVLLILIGYFFDYPVRD